jgi:hypothetical protein
MRRVGFLTYCFFLLTFAISTNVWGKARLPIRDFLSGYTVDGVLHKGMGIESPGMVELMSLAYSALGTVQARSVSAEKQLQIALAGFTAEEARELERLSAKIATIPKAEWQGGQPAPTSRLTAEEIATWDRLLAKSRQPEELKFSLQYLRRAKLQYWLALELMNELVKRSMEEFDLRGFEKQQANFKAVLYQKTDAAEGDRRDRLVKGYALEQAGKLFRGALRFLSLKQQPVTKSRFKPSEVAPRVTKSLEPGDLNREEGDLFQWLDWDIFVNQEPESIQTFLAPDPEIRKKIRVYANTSLMPAAEDMTKGFTALLNNADPNSPLMKIDLNDPSEDQKQALARLVLSKDILRKITEHSVVDDITTDPEMKKAAGLVTFYLYCADALVDSFNVNTHDSFQIMRSALYVLVRHVLDIDGHENWAIVKHQKKPDGSDVWVNGEVHDYVPFPNTAPNYKPVAKVVQTAYDFQWKIYWNDTQKGPKLADPKADEENRRAEFATYHGNLLREVFGVDFSYYVWPRSKAYQGDWKNDPRTNQTIPPEVWKKDPRTGQPVPEARDAAGNYLPEATAIQSGDIWAELGTGVGSELISFATEPSDPSSEVKNFIHKASVWGMAKEKLYNRWVNGLSWASNSLNEASNLVNQTPLIKWAQTRVSKNISVKWDVPFGLSQTRPGLDVDYSGFSHVGLVEVFGDDLYPQMKHANFIDAFPQRMRGQVWRAHGWGANHSRKGAIFRLRPEIGLEHRANFSAKFQSAQQDQAAKWAAIPEIARSRARLTEASRLNVENAQNECVAYLKTVRFTQNEWDNAPLFKELRGPIRPVFDFCMNTFKLAGLTNFKAQILDKAGSDQLSGEELVKQMGELVVGVSRAIRRQSKGYEGMGNHFDNNFDTLSWGDLYCSETVTLSWLRGTGLMVWEPAGFKGVLKKMLADLDSDLIKQATGGFDKVPYGPEDNFYAPQDILLTDYGHDRFRPILITAFTVFGVNDE